jgi:enoyl-CoA hydratase/carnithine racemase
MGDTQSPLRVERIKDVLIWHIHDPDSLNALGPKLLAFLESALQELEKVSESGIPPRVVGVYVTSVATKSGQKVFMAGGHLKELATLSEEEAHDFFRRTRLLRHRMQTLPQPFVCFIDGIAIGGGAEFALFCDYRLGSPEAKFYFKQLEIGLPCGFIGTKGLCHLIGIARVQQLLFGKKLISGKKSLQMGLVHRLMKTSLSPERFARWLQRNFAGLELSALVATKQSMYGSQDALGEERELISFMKCWRNETHAAVLERFK